MRKVYVVLTSLFVGLSFGFIVPTDSGTSETIKRTNKYISTEKNLAKINKMDENELFENGEDRFRNINERSYILMNQKYWNQFPNHLYKSLKGKYQHLTEVERLPELYLKREKPEKNRFLFAPYDVNIVDFMTNNNIYQYKYPNDPNLQRIQKLGEVVKYQKPFLHYLQHNTPSPKTSVFPILKKVTSKPKTLFVDSEQMKGISRPKSETSNYKKRITSRMQRKPNSYICSISKPYMLHRSSYNKKQNVYDKDFQNSVSPIQQFTTSSDWSEIEKFDNYIKNALEEIEQSELANDIDMNSESCNTKDLETST